MSIFKTTKVAVALLALVACPAVAGISADFLLRFDPADDVHVFLRLATGQYAVPPAQAATVCSRVSSPEDAAVVMFLAFHSGVHPDAILARRARGESWHGIMVGLGLRTDLLYAGLPRPMGPPYGNAHGYRARQAARRAPLAPPTDQDVRELVALQVAAGYFQVAPEVLVARRHEGTRFVTITGDLYRRSPRRDTADRLAYLDEEDEGPVASPGARGKTAGARPDKGKDRQR